MKTRIYAGKNPQYPKDTYVNKRSLLLTRIKPSLQQIFILKTARNDYEQMKPTSIGDEYKLLVCL